MLKKYALLCFLAYTVTYAQPPELKLTASGFDSIEVPLPATKNDKLIDVTKAWAMEYNHGAAGSGQNYDVTNVTSNTITISSFKRSAFSYHNRGEEFYFKIRYTMKIAFYGSRYTISFAIPEIYGQNNEPIKYTLPDYFTSKGTLKEGYDGLDASLEDTVNGIVLSHYNFLINYR